MAVNADSSITSDKAFTKRKLEQATATTGTTPSEFQLEIVEIREAELAKEIFSGPDQPFKKRILALHSLQKDQKYGTRHAVSQLQPINAGNKVADVLRKREVETVGQTGSGVDDVDSGTQDEVIKKAKVNMADQTQQETATDATAETVDDELVTVQKEGLSPGTLHQQETVGTVCNTEQIYKSSHLNQAIQPKGSKGRNRKPGSEVVEMSGVMDEKSHPFSEKVDGVNKSDAFQRSRSCPEEVLACGGNNTIDYWPLTTTEETSSFFISRSSPGIHDKSYPSAKKIEELSELFKQTRAKTNSAVEHKPEEFTAETKRPFPPFRTIAFGPNPERVSEKTSPEPEQENTETKDEPVSHHKTSGTVTSDHTDSDINLMSDVSLSDDCDDMIDVLDTQHKPYVREMSDVSSPVLDQLLIEQFLVKPSSQSTVEQDPSNNEGEKVWRRRDQLSSHDIVRMDRRRLTNRLAARKCRMKQQEREGHLKKQFQEYESKNTRLSYEVRELQKIKASLELILTNHMHSKTCKIPETESPHGVTNVRDTVHSGNSKPVIKTTGEKKQEEESSTTGKATTPGAKDGNPGLLQRRMPVMNPVLPKLKLHRAVPETSPQITTHRAGPEISPQITSAPRTETNPQIVTHRPSGPPTNPQIVTHRPSGPPTNPQIVTHRPSGPQTNPQIVTHRPSGPQTNPQIVTHRPSGPQTNPQIVTQRPSGPQTNPQIVTHRAGFETQPQISTDKQNNKTVTMAASTAIGSNLSSNSTNRLSATIVTAEAPMAASKDTAATQFVRYKHVQGPQVSNQNVNTLQHTEYVKQTAQKPGVSKPHKKSSLKKAEIKQVSAEQLEKILKKGGKVVSAKDKEGRDISVDRMLGGTFKRPFDVKPVSSMGKSAVKNASGGVETSYCKGKLDAAHGKGEVQIPYLYKRAAAVYAMKHGLPSSNREQIMAHLRAKQKAQEPPGTDRAATSASRDVTPGTRAGLQDVRPARVTSTSSTQGRSAIIIPTDPTEPLFQNNQVPALSLNETPNEQLLQLIHARQTQHLPKATSLNEKQTDQIHKVTLQVMKQHPDVLVNTSQNGKTMDHASHGHGKHGTTGSYVIVSQTSPASTDSHRLRTRQQTYTLSSTQTPIQPSSSITSIVNTQPSSLDNYKPQGLKRSSSVTELKPRYQSQVIQPEPLEKSARLRSADVQAETSMAVSALLQLKSGIVIPEIKGNMNSMRTESVRSSTVSPSVVSVPVTVGGQSSTVTTAPRSVYFYPSGVPILLSGTGNATPQQFSTMVSQSLVSSGQVGGLGLSRAPASHSGASRK